MDHKCPCLGVRVLDQPKAPTSVWEGLLGQGLNAVQIAREYFSERTDAHGVRSRFPMSCSSVLKGSDLGRVGQCSACSTRGLQHMHAALMTGPSAEWQLPPAQAVKPVLGKYYRTPAKSPGPIPVHLLEPLVRSFRNDHYVEDTGDIVFYKRDPNFSTQASPAK